MKTAHLLLVHKDPQQVERLIRSLQHPDFDFYIHLDKKVDISPFMYLSTLPNVFFIKERVRITWAGYSQLEATFNGVRQICIRKEEYNFINLLTGQDYPIKPTEVIINFFKTNTGKEFMAYRDIINDWKEAQGRYKHYHLTDFKLRGRTRIERLINTFLPARKIPEDLHPFGESSYWMLSPEVALYVANKFQNNRSLRRFFSLVWGGDEFAFQTIILNSKYVYSVIKNNYRYIDWTENKANPKILKKSDFEELKRSPMLFARKFDRVEDSEILNMIDVHLLQK